MRYRSGILALAAAVLLAAAPAAHAARSDSSVAEPRTPPAPAAVSAPESIRVFLLTELAVPQSLAVDSAQLRAHEERAVVAMMAGLAAAHVPVFAGAVFRRDDNVPRLDPRQCSSDSVPSAAPRLNHPSWRARASMVPTSLIRLTRR